METKLNKEKLSYFKEIQFYNEYIILLISRLVSSSMEIEEDLGDIFSSTNAMRFMDNITAFNVLLNSLDKDISKDLIKTVANLINRNSMYISTEYRKTGKVLESPILTAPISSPEDIEKDMDKLIYDYNNTWKSKEVFEREALFITEFLRIHPYEDGNGRTSRLLLNYNLIKQNYAPVIITNNLMEKFIIARTNGDIKTIRDMFEELSAVEYKVIDMLIDEHFNKKEDRYTY